MNLFNVEKIKHGYIKINFHFRLNYSCYKQFRCKGRLSSCIFAYNCIVPCCILCTPTTSKFLVFFRPRLLWKENVICIAVLEESKKLF